MIRVFTRIALAGSGALLGLIGSALLASPQAFLAKSGIVIDRDSGLLSELAAPAGLLLVSGGLMMLGAVRRRFAKAGLAAGATVYGTYGAGHLVSMALYGMPSQSLVTAMLIELCIAALLAVMLMITAPASKLRSGRRLSDVAA